MNKIIIKVWNKYQKMMWYISQAGTEVGKPLRFYSEAALLLLMLDNFGFSLSPGKFIMLYIIILLIAWIAGIVLAKIGTVKYNATLSNNHNLELQEILKIVKKMEKK